MPRLPNDDKYELERVAALRRYAVLDTAPEQAFDNIVKLATRICGTPIALIALVDEARQWFKASLGWDRPETERAIAFCRYTIDRTGVHVVPDALVDPKFSNNPLVTSDPQIRFYAGVPLVSPDGYPIGALCVIDRVPRSINQHQSESLELLARETMTQLELRRVLQNLSIAQRELHDANIELQAFSAAVAHDLRAPLRHISGYADVLLDDYANHLPPQARDHLQRIRLACGATGEIIAALLRLSRVSHEQLRVEPVDLSALVNEIGAALATREAGRRVDLRIAANMHVIADRGLMRVLIENLLSNAWKFTRTRSAPQVEVGWRQRGPTREYFVRDNGVGFDAGQTRVEPQPFMRRHKDTAFEGVGLGLTIADRIVRRHGGELRIDSAPDQGTAVSFTLQPLLSAS